MLRGVARDRNSTPIIHGILELLFTSDVRRRRRVAREVRSLLKDRLYGGFFAPNVGRNANSQSVQGIPNASGGKYKRVQHSLQSIPFRVLAFPEFERIIASVVRVVYFEEIGIGANAGAVAHVRKTSIDNVVPVFGWRRRFAVVPLRLFSRHRANA